MTRDDAGSDSDSDSGDSSSFDSPPPSDEEDNGVDRKPLGYTPGGVRPAGRVPTPATVPRGRPTKKAREEAIFRNRMLRLEQKKQRREILNHKRKRGDGLLDDDDDDDSDAEGANKAVVPPSSAKDKAKGASLAADTPVRSITMPLSRASTGALSSATKPVESVAGKANPSVNDPLLVLSSDDEDEDDGHRMPFVSHASLPPRANLPPAMAAALRKAQASRARLTQAQLYKGEDVSVSVEADPSVSVPTLAPRRAPSGGGTSASGPPARSLGRPLLLSCRCAHLVIAGAREAVPKGRQTIELSVREREPLSALADRIREAHSLPPGEGTVVTMTFDGETLDPGRDPLSYDLEAGYLVDVYAAAPRRLGASEQRRKPSPGSGPSLGRALEFTCRIRVREAEANQRGRPLKRPRAAPETLTRTVRVREREPVRKIVERLGPLPRLASAASTTVRFDGCVLDPCRTPSSYEMEDGDMVEVCIEAREGEQQQPTQKTPARKQQQPPAHPPLAGIFTRRSNTSRAAPRTAGGFVLKLVVRSASKTTTTELRVTDAATTLAELLEGCGVVPPAPNAVGTRRTTRSRRAAATEGRPPIRFGGMVLDPTKTPADYHLQDGDTLEVGEGPSAGAAASTTAPEGQSCEGSCSSRAIEI
ncbi:unnamed protein product [Pseudo-nitzschia multistriata]|uniref:Rad60/SUMO-like domain-containing protein n=1 Tax=Pseudo-nitzschia multistriata TaxID=183589 RepID=A0A448ZGM1_9STRA|nr:unnamed protein product [Pseudo-nitzschia multistriata]